MNHHHTLCSCAPSTTGASALPPAGGAGCRARVCARCRRRKASRGMTLIEIMVVMAIISLILGGVGVMAFNQFNKAKLKDARVNAVQIQQLVEQFHMEKNRCPKNVAELKATGFAQRAAKDPWGNEYEIHCEPGKMEVVSAGPDGQMGTEDDIGSTDEVDKHDGADDDAKK